MKKILLGFIFGVVTATGVSVMANGLLEKAEFNDGVQDLTESN